MSTEPTYQLGHLLEMSDDHGLFEHALGTRPRAEHGYCTDDNARLVVVMARDLSAEGAVQLFDLGVKFVTSSFSDDGRCHNRMDRHGAWIDRPNTEDCWGRALWALGAVVGSNASDNVRSDARTLFDHAVGQRSAWPRAMAFAGIGGAEILRVEPDHEPARRILGDAARSIPRTPTGGWRWPERRLTYANAVIAEVVIAAGSLLDRPDELDRGLSLLAWLLDLQTCDGRLSLTGSGGRGPDDTSPQFDQQPIEAAALADACSRAYSATNDRAWLRGVTMAARWFAGHNDLGIVMYDETGGGGFDGLHTDRVNTNQGAESTLAFLSTMQRARTLVTST